MEDDGDNSEPLLTMETKLMTAEINSRGNNEEIIETKEVNVTETETRPGLVNWSILADEFTMEKLWTSRDWKSILKHFFLAFSTGFFFSALDVLADSTACPQRSIRLARGLHLSRCHEAIPRVLDGFVGHGVAAVAVAATAVAAATSAAATPVGLMNSNCFHRYDLRKDIAHGNAQSR